MKKIFIILIIVFSITVQSQTFRKNTIYILGRGTLSKKEFIGEKFNIENKNLTHLGLGLFVNDTLKIYNVSSDKFQNKSSLIVETIEEFKNVNDIFYFGIWYYECSNVVFEEFKKTLNTYESSVILFDKKFELKNDNNLYCSEFVFNVLNNLKPFQFLPCKKELNKIEKEILEREELIYYPVDLFLSNNNIKQLYVNTIN